MRQAGLVSIIINNYNYACYLRAAIDSALAQSYPEVEVLVVDDGSTDTSAEIIRSYGDQIIPILKTNGGQASAFNAGWKHSHGEIILFLDADDVLLEYTVAQVVQAFELMTRLAKVQFRMEVIDARGACTGITKPPEYLPMRSGDLRAHALTFPFDMTWMPTSANAFPSWVFDQIFPIPEHAYGAIGADWYIAHIPLLLGNVLSLDTVGAHYRIHGGNNYERGVQTLNIEHIRQTIRFAETTRHLIERVAVQQGLRDEIAFPNAILSVSLIANRLISRKLDPEHHPVAGDTIGRLCYLGIVASARRFDVPLYGRLLFAAWFVITAGAPRSAARWLATVLLFPQQRTLLNQVLGRLHRRKGPMSTRNAP